MVIEDRALALAEELDGQGQGGLAARLREAIPAGFGLGDEHVGFLRDVLVAVTDRTSPPQSSAAAKILAALDDLPAHIGRRGRVWVSEDSEGGTFSAYWDEDDWLEEGPQGVAKSEALLWAARRSDDVRLIERG